jgi:hypothetical protein
MTHITEGRVIGNHAEMGVPPPAAVRNWLTITEILRSGVWRRARRTEMAAAESTWDSEGGATGEGESPPSGTEGLQQASYTRPGGFGPRDPWFLTRRHRTARETRARGASSAL